MAKNKTEATTASPVEQPVNGDDTAQPQAESLGVQDLQGAAPVSYTHLTLPTNREV